MPPRRKPADDDSDASTERENDYKPLKGSASSRPKAKKRVSSMGPSTTLPLNDIENAVDTDSDDEQMARPGVKRRQSNIDLNDDQAEKRKRRKSAKQSVSFNDREGLNRSKMNKEGSPEAEDASALPRTPKVSALARANMLSAVAQTPVPAVAVDILNSKYEEWMKMATDNKINANNAWNFALIDYFQDMSLLRNELDNSINFQKASFTLDGCVKIWTSRVDSVGTETGKLLSNLADEIRGVERGEDGEEGQDGQDGEGKQKKQKSHRQENTLAKNVAQLQVKKLDLEFTVDPLFKKTCADFDEGGAMGLLMNHLAVDEKIRVVFDAGDSRLEGMDEETPEADTVFVDLTDIRAKFMPSVDAVLDKSLTESLANFHFAKGQSLDMDLDGLHGSFGVDDGPHAAGGLEDDDDGGMGADYGGGDEMMMDEAGPAEDFFTGDQAVPGETFGANNGMPAEGAAGPGPLGPQENFDPRRPTNERELVLAMTEDGEEMLDYFDSAVMKNWAGPQHWKLRRVAKKADPNADDSMPTRNKKEKVAFEIDFSAPAQPSKELFVPATGTTILLASGTGAQIAGAAGAKKKKRVVGRRDDHLLPDDMHFSSTQLLRLFRKPKFTEWKGAYQEVAISDTNTSRISLGLGADFTGGEGEIDERFWANAALAHAAEQAGGNDDEQMDDTTPFNTQFLGDDDFDDTPGFGEDLDAPSGLNGLNEQDDLLAATQGQLKRTRAEYVNYAKKAKRVDVKKLKDNIWKSLDIVVDHDKKDQDQDDIQPEDSNEPKIPTDPKEARHFSAVLGGLESRYPKEKMEDISTSFCFICLLHLANEQGLKLEVDPTNRIALDAEDPNGEVDDSALRVGEIWGLNVYRDPNAARAA